ncbi:AMP-binding protein, partial [Streptomyces sp. NRRL S-813]|uniref:AMP-binding protein n=1 Tax=Streptomyces sp. NRRL S-813 TaxID=1463919 RepID=UPI00055CD942
MNLAGEVVTDDLVAQVFAAGVAQVRNLYGPSETTTYSTAAVMHRKDGFAATIGRPIGNTRVYILDSSGR